MITSRLPENVRKQIAAKIELLRAGSIQSPNDIIDYRFARQVSLLPVVLLKSNPTDLKLTPCSASGNRLLN